MVIAINKYLRNLGLGSLVLFFTASCLDNKQSDLNGYLGKVLSSQETAIKTVMDRPQEYELQIQLLLPNDAKLIGEDLTTIRAVDHSQGQYFYPASTVKLPVAVIAAEWTEYQDHISIDTPYRIDKDTVSYTLAQDIIDIFSVSDNQAFNRLYDLLGRDYINQRMEALNIGAFRLAHRLSVSDAADATHPKYFFETTLGIQAVQASPDKTLDPIQILGTKKGLGYIEKNNLVRAPMDFSYKNYFPLATMMKFMKILFPLDCDGCDSEINWSKQTERFVTSLMRTVPREQGYSEVDYPDGYVKFFFLGDSNMRINPALNIYNKVGYAYGTLTDIAYIVDSKHDLHYILGATLLVNENGIFNDNLYEYDSIGLPFLGTLSRQLHQLLINAKTRR